MYYFLNGKKTKVDPDETTKQTIKPPPTKPTKRSRASQYDDMYRPPIVVKRTAGTSAKYDWFKKPCNLILLALALVGAYTLYKRYIVNE